MDQIPFIFVVLLSLGLAQPSSATLPELPVVVLSQVVDVSDPAAVPVDDICKEEDMPALPLPSDELTNLFTETCPQRPGQTTVCVCMNPPPLVLAQLQAVPDFVDNRTPEGWIVACGNCTGTAWVPLNAA